MLSNINVSEKVNGELLKISQELVKKAVSYCACKYNFNAEEVYRELGLGEIKVEISKKLKVEKVKISSIKASLPLPYNGEIKKECCSALRQNNGLYTQCEMIRNDSSDFCKGCANKMQKTGAEVPEYGTIQMRNGVGIFEYIDPKGRKPIAYAKVMKKYKLTKEQVLEEAKKMNMKINEEHFVVPEEAKRGRPSKNVEKEVKEKVSRGRPKKTKKVVELDGDTEDLFATLVANANEMEDVKSEEDDVESDDDDQCEEEIIKKNVASKEQAKLEKKEADRLAREAKKKADEEEKAAQKAAKEAEKEAAKKEKEEKLAAEKAAKEAAKKEKEAEKAAKEAAKKEKEAEKAAKIAEKEATKKQKEASKKEKSPKKETASKKETPTKEADVEEEDEPDIVKKIEFEGKKYLKSKKTGIIYDYNEYITNSEQVVVGKWNDATNKIVFNASEEEDEEEYEN